MFNTAIRRCCLTFVFSTPKRLLAAFGLVIAAGSFIDSPLCADVIHVPTTYSTIQAAINAAATGDVIIVSPGTYTENINFLGKAITVRSAAAEGNDALIVSTIIDGDGNGPTVTFENNENANAMLYGFTIIGGSGKSDAGFVSGGGIFCKNASPTIRRNFIEQNSAAVGGGIYITGGGPLIERNCIRKNFASHSGGGVKITSDSTAELRNNLITGNRTQLQGGAGIDCFSTIFTSSPLIRSNVIAGNYANNKGSAVSCSASSPDIVNNIIIFNRTGTANGSAIFQDGFSTRPVCFNDVWSNFPSNHGTTITPCAEYELSVDPLVVENGFWADVNNTPANLSDDIWIDGDYHLLSGSPLIDAGDSSVPWNGFQNDYDDEARFIDDPCTANTGAGPPPAIDIGAYEFSSTAIAVDSEYVGPNNGSWFVASSWSTGEVPDCQTDALVEKLVQIPQARAVANQLVVSEGGTVNLTASGELITGEQYIGQLGATGKFQHFGGTSSIGGPLNISKPIDTSMKHSPGVYDLYDGLLNCVELNVGQGYKADALYRQFGGECIVAERLLIGNGNGAMGRCEIYGGVLETGYTIVGAGGGSATTQGGHGEIFLDSADWINHNYLIVGGGEGYGKLELLNDATLTANGGFNAPDGEGVSDILVNGTGTLLEVKDFMYLGNGYIFVSMNLVISDGGLVSCPNALFAGDTGCGSGTYKATVEVTGDQSLWDCSGSIVMGGSRLHNSEEATPAEIVVVDGGMVHASDIRLLPNGRIVGNDGTVDADVNAMGQIKPGLNGGDGFGELNLNGNLDMSGSWFPDCPTSPEEPASGIVIIQLGGFAPGITHDVLDISGELHGNPGTLQVALAGAFDPPVQSSFVIGTYGSLAAPFGSLDLPKFTDSREMVIEYDPPVGGPGVIRATIVVGCASDINNDGMVSVDDLLAVIGTWGPCIDCQSDLNGDDVVNVDDLLAVIGGWGACP